MFSWATFAFGLSTTLFLQVLSNYANDLGDTLHGADSATRIGPKRAVQAGLISKEEMKAAVVVFSILSLISGLGLLAVATGSVQQFLIFLGLGIAAIAAAILYTNGKRPYGYAGLGDISVFIFFGLVAVGGIFYLQTGGVVTTILLPAISAGLLAVGVLNLNNMRDVTSDADAGKTTIPLRLGFEGGKVYHSVLIVGALLCVFFYADYQSGYFWVSFLAAPLLILHLVKVLRVSKPADFDPYLKVLALTALLHNVAVGLAAYLAG